MIWNLLGFIFEAELHGNIETEFQRLSEGAESLKQIKLTGRQERNWSDLGFT